MSKKGLVFFLGLVLFGTSVVVRADTNQASELNSINTLAQSSSSVPKTVTQDTGDATPTEVKKTAEDNGLDYSSGAGDKATKMDMTIDIASWVADRVTRALIQLFPSLNGSILFSSGPQPPVWFELGWFSFYISWNLVDTATQLGHAAVNKFMRDATYITASFTGAEGYVTDKWVGPPNYNQTVAIMGDVTLGTQSFGSVAFDPDEYAGLENPDSASARTLVEYRKSQLIEDQRSLENVADLNWEIHYRAQQRSIKALAGALTLKKELAKLTDADQRINAEYGTKPKALNTAASRRVLHDALMLLKMNVMAARAKMRAETLELDFKPLKEDPDDDDDDTEPTTPSLTPNVGGVL